MLTNRNKAITALCFSTLIATGVLLNTTGQINLAAVITGITNEASSCIEQLRDESTFSDYEIIPARLNSGPEKDYILKGLNESLCGSAGCVHRLCIVEGQKGRIIPFAYAAETLRVKDTITNEMHDIQLQGNSISNLQWDGARYVVVQ